MPITAAPPKLAVRRRARATPAAAPQAGRLLPASGHSQQHPHRKGAIDPPPSQAPRPTRASAAMHGNAAAAERSSSCSTKTDSPSLHPQEPVPSKTPPALSPGSPGGSQQGPAPPRPTQSMSRRVVEAKLAKQNAARLEAVHQSVASTQV